MILLWVAAASAQDEDEIFGGTPTPAAETPAPEDDPLGGPRTTDADILSRLGAEEDDLTVGGRLYLRGDVGLTEGAGFEDATLASPNLLDLFVDARPNDRVRVYAQGRLAHDWTVTDGETDTFGQAKVASKVTLDQLWVKGDVAHRVYLTAGRQRIKWGSGRFWNPTDFVNEQVRDPLAVYDERTGVSLVKVHVPVGAANFYALANLEEAGGPADVGGALRAEIVAGPAELALSAATRDGQPLRLGADLSAGLGPVDVHVEGAVRHGDTGPYWQGDLDFETFTLPTQRDRSEDWIPQVVAGAELGVRYNDEDSVYVGVEGFWNDAGYDDATLYPWMFFEGGYQAFYVGRAYGAAYVYLPSPGQWDDVGFTASWIGNLSDGSNVARLDARVTVLTHLALNAYGSWHFGELGELRYGLEVPPIPGMLDDGLTIDPPMLEVGVGANVEF